MSELLTWTETNGEIRQHVDAEGATADREQMVPRTMDREALYAALVLSKAKIEPGLTEDEIDAVEARFGFQFPPDYGMLLSLGLPTGESWPDWRNGDEALLRDRLALPVDDLVWEISARDLWWPAWGDRPDSSEVAAAIGRRHLESLAPLISIHAYRYLSSYGDQPGNPVFSYFGGSDIICFSTDLLEYFRDQFSRPQVARTDPRGRARRIPFWSDFTGR